MSDSHPSVEDEIDRALRLGLATAAQVADRFARARQDLIADARRSSEQQHRLLLDRFRAEGASAVARLSVVDRSEWWQHATAEQIVSMYELARQWQADQPHAATAADTIAHQVRTRYGIDLAASSADAGGIRAAVDRIEQERAFTGSPAVPGRTDDLAAAVAAVTQAERRDTAVAAAADDRDAAGTTVSDTSSMAGERAGNGERESVETQQQTASPRSRPASDRAAPAEPGPHFQGLPTSPPLGYDSVERRRATAARMRQDGISEASIAVAMRADTAHAHPATEAATSPTVPAPPARAATHSARRADRSR